MDDTTTPTDRYYIVYIVVLNLGIGSVLPWNAFSTANSYFVDYKLADTNATSVDLRPYRESFLSFLGFFAMVPNLVLQIFNLLYKSNKDSGIRKRITMAMILQTVVLVLTIVLASVDSSLWSVAFFYITMVCVVVLNMAAGIYQNLSWATAANLPMKYSNAVMIGTNASGTIFAAAMIVSIAVASENRLSALIFFVFTLIYHVANLLMYQFLFRNNYFLNFRSLLEEVEKTDANECNGSESVSEARKTSVKDNLLKMYELSKICWTQLLNVGLLYFTALSIYPALQGSIESVDDVISVRYFTPVTTFLTFNLTALIGSLLTTNGIPIPGPDRLWIPVCLRLLLIPAMLFCNYRPATRTVPVLFKSDLVYITISAIQGLSVGYLASLTVMYAPRMVSRKDSQTVGMMVGATGIICTVLGVLATFLWPVLIG